MRKEGARDKEQGKPCSRHRKAITSQDLRGRLTLNIPRLKKKRLNELKEYFDTFFFNLVFAKDYCTVILDTSILT